MSYPQSSRAANTTFILHKQVKCILPPIRDPFEATVKRRIDPLVKVSFTVPNSNVLSMVSNENIEHQSIEVYIPIDCVLVEVPKTDNLEVPSQEVDKNERIFHLVSSPEDMETAKNKILESLKFDGLKWYKEIACCVVGYKQLGQHADTTNLIDLHRQEGQQELFRKLAAEDTATGETPNVSTLKQNYEQNTNYEIPTSTYANDFRQKTPGTELSASTTESYKKLRSHNHSPEFQQVQRAGPLSKPEYHPTLEGGIQWGRSSCYLDSILYAMFRFCNRFDEIFNGHPDPNVQAARQYLKLDIVGPLRNGGRVRESTVYKLRDYCAGVLKNNSYRYAFMDAALVIDDLFRKVMHFPEFYAINNITKGYVLQPYTIDIAGQKPNILTISELLKYNAKRNGITLQSVPSTALLVKLPVNDGVREFKYAYPNLMISLSEIVREPGNVQTATLTSVICLKSGHYTSFVRYCPDGRRDTRKNNAIWLFHNSTYANVSKCDGLDEALRQLNPNQEGIDSRNVLYMVEKHHWLKQLLGEAYICVYVPDDNVQEPRAMIY